MSFHVHSEKPGLEALVHGVNTALKVKMKYSIIFLLIFATSSFAQQDADTDFDSSTNGLLAAILEQQDKQS